MNANKLSFCTNLHLGPIERERKREGAGAGGAKESVSSLNRCMETNLSLVIHSQCGL